jgi:hypothetical protein
MRPGTDSNENDGAARIIRGRYLLDPPRRGRCFPQRGVPLFERGQRTSTDVLIAAGLIADAQFAEIDALTQYQNAKVDLAVATGTMLGYGRVAFGPPADAPGGKPAPAP